MKQSLRKNLLHKGLNIALFDVFLGHDYWPIIGSPTTAWRSFRFQRFIDGFHWHDIRSARYRIFGIVIYSLSRDNWIAGLPCTSHDGPQCFIYLLNDFSNFFDLVVRTRTLDPLCIQFEFQLTSSGGRARKGIGDISWLGWLLAH